MSDIYENREITDPCTLRQGFSPWRVAEPIQPIKELLQASARQSVIVMMTSEYGREWRRVTHCGECGQRLPRASTG